MENELRIVHREETFNDFAVRELAAGRSACICRIQFGRCTKDECTSCDIGRQYRNCYNQMNDYDKQRLSKYVSQNYVQDSLYPGKWMSYKALRKHTAKWFALIAVCLFFIFIPLFLMAPGDKPSDVHTVSQSTNNQIIVTIKLAQKYVKDVNRDGKVNCIDYACSFKLIWDAIYPEQAGDCIIIRNHSLTLNHLYVGVYENNSLIFVEPWTSNPDVYDMQTIWGEKWNPRFNKYDETEKWLNKTGRY